MPRLSITTAWNEASAILKRDFGALFAIALAFMLLPNFAFQALVPRLIDPSAGISLRLIIVPFLLLLPVALMSAVGSLAITTLALGRERVVGSAIGHAVRRVLPMLGAGALLLLGFVLVCAPLFFAVGLRAQDVLQPTPAVLGRFLLAMLVFFAIFLFVGVRLMMMTPVAAGETAGPIGIIRRSWQLTRGRFWKLFGFLLLMVIVLGLVGGVASLVLGIVIAAVAGAPEPGSASGLLLLLVSLLVNSAFAVVMATMIARIYLQLAGEGPVSAERVDVPAGPRPPARVRRDGDAESAGTSD
ncbi:MAG TPA: glycerophosphoryl diester phosphodiesterase membrane domain-containing protein [Allosphingosinicella sp.]|nr:glycerophosphoryl diester phosphodiesterase membrane domain-containing protein [Allosphingosinicella sp.]